MGYLSNTSFAFRLNNSVDPGWGGGNFSHQMFVVLIDNAAGGTTEGILASNVKTQEEYPWDIGFYGDNWVKRFFTPETLETPQDSGHGITTNYEMIDGEHWFEMYVPETLIGSVANNTWKYYVMVASSDFNNFRNHMAENGLWNFGGGDDGPYDPNYCDILVPTAADPVALQEFISSSYDVGAQRYAEMLAVGEGISFEEDTTSPVVTITAPENQANLTWTGYDVIANVTYTVDDPTQGTYYGVSDIKVYHNSVLIPDAGKEWTEITLEAGINLVRVVSYDLTGNSGYDEIYINVNDTRPAIEITTTMTEYIINPADSTHEFLVEWTASDDYGLANFTYIHNGVEIENNVLNTTTSQAFFFGLGEHNITIRAFNNIGSWAQDSLIVNIIEDEVPPTIAITTDAAIYTLGETGTTMDILVEWTGDDNYQPDDLTYEVWLNGVLEDTITLSEYTVNVGAGNHTVIVLATDLYDNTAQDTYLFTVEAYVPVDDTTDDTTDDSTDDTTDDDDDGVGIPGYNLGFIAVSVISVGFIIIRKRK
ncbi:MAG: glucodextranase DOMON-like domain-containing protein [Promethearchaeota archaeon]